MFHTALTPGELTERIDADVTALSNFFSQFVIRVLGNVLLRLYDPHCGEVRVEVRSYDWWVRPACASA